MENGKQKESKQHQSPRALPVTHMNGKAYFIDRRLRQYRNVENPHDFINFDDDPVVFSYTRAQAIEDGVLVDISGLAREVGFKFPVAVTSGVYTLLNDTAQPGQSFGGRALDMLVILHLEIKKAGDSDTIYFAPFFNTSDHLEAKQYQLWSKCGPGDNHEPVITIMLPDED